MNFMYIYENNKFCQNMLILKEKSGELGRVARKGRTYDHPTEQWDGSLLAPNCSTKASLRETDRNLS